MRQSGDIETLASRQYLSTEIQKYECIFNKYEDKLELFTKICDIGVALELWREVHSDHEFGDCYGIRYIVLSSIFKEECCAVEEAIMSVPFHFHSGYAHG